VFTPALLVADLPLRDPVTVADRLGAWPERVLTAVALLALLATLGRRRRRADEAVDRPAPVLAGSR
jgi:apolipoprotein N-acyltransferase